MIANICSLLLCGFAITSNIKTIESAGNQITPVRFFIQLSNEHYLRTLNNLKTFNKNPINIKTTDMRILSSLVCESLKDYQLKLKSRGKLEKRAQDIKCSFCVIVKSNILYLKNLFGMLKREEPFIYDEEIIKGFEEEAKIILQLLLLSDLETGKWLWIYFLKIVAIRQYGEHKHFMRENPFEDHQLHTGVLDFIEKCMAENYLPKTTTKIDLVLKNPQIYNNMFSHVRDSGWVSDVLNDRVLVTVEFLYLKPFWDDENQLLFGQITDVNVDWSKAKKRHKVEVAITKEFVENRTWIYKPYDRLDHQNLLIKIIDARLYCYLSVVLHIFEKQLLIYGERTLNHMKDLIYKAIQAILDLTGFKDEFLVVIISEFKFAKIRDIDDIKDILARVRAKANEILNDLNGAGKIEINWLSFNVNNDQMTTNYLIRIIVDFKIYLKKLKDLCLPFEYRVFLHFMDVIKLTVAQYI